MGTDPLTFITAEDERCPGYNLHFPIGKGFLLLGKIGFAEMIVICSLRQAAARAYALAGTAMETFPVHRSVRCERQCCQDGTDKAVRSIHGMDETLIVTYKSQTGLYGQQPFCERGCVSNAALCTAIRGQDSRQLFQIGRDDEMIIFELTVERKIRLFCLSVVIGNRMTTAALQSGNRDVRS